MVQYYYDFRFGSKKLSDFGGVIINEDGWKISNGLTSTKTTEKLPMRDGELFMYETLNPRIITIPILIEQDIDLNGFYSWLLDGEQELELIGDNKKINAILDNQIDFKCYYNNGFNGITSLSFIAYDPYYKALNEDYKTLNTTVNQVQNVIILGNTNSSPIIRFTPNGNQSSVKIKVNDDTIILMDVKGEVIINCEKEEVTEYVNGEPRNAFAKFKSTDYYDFPMLKPYYTNKITLLQGSVTNFKILPNTRWK